MRLTLSISALALVFLGACELTENSLTLKMVGVIDPGVAKSRSRTQSEPLVASPVLTAQTSPSDRSRTAGQAAAGTAPKSGSFDVESIAVSVKIHGEFPYVKGLEGFEVMSDELSTWKKQTDFGEYMFQPSPAQGIEIGGQFFMTHFKAKTPNSQSTGKIVESYRRMIESNGGKMLYKGQFYNDAIVKAARSEQLTRDGATYLLRTPEREIWTQVSVRDDGDEYILVVVERGPLVLATTALSASDLKRAIDEFGKAIVYVNFQFDKADLRPDSKPVIDEVFALLKSDPALKLSIEGHTDALGAPDYNQALSQRRAAAVRAALLERGVSGGDPERLAAVGRGSSAPIADNKTEEGRARNRRVELIKQK